MVDQLLGKKLKSGKNQEMIPLLIVNKTKKRYEKHRKRQIVETIYSKNMDNSNEYFMVLSALNLLNSAIKDTHWKHDLSYGFIKGKAAELFEKWIKVPVEGVNAYYNSQEGAVFFSVDGVVFSYHRIKLSEKIRSLIQTSGNKPITWTGVRLQKIPVELFDLAKAV
mgnify:CR=1 FL=1